MDESNITLLITWIDDAQSDDVMIDIELNIYCENGWMRNEITTSSQQLYSVGEVFVEHSFEFESEHQSEFGFGDGWIVNRFLSSPIYIKLFPMDERGKIGMLFDMKVEDNPDPLARCQMYVSTEVGLLEKFGRAIKNLANRKQLLGCSLNEYFPIGDRTGYFVENR